MGLKWRNIFFSQCDPGPFGTVNHAHFACFGPVLTHLNAPIACSFPCFGAVWTAKMADFRPKMVKHAFCQKCSATLWDGSRSIVRLVWARFIALMARAMVLLGAFTCLRVGVEHKPESVRSLDQRICFVPMFVVCGMWCATIPFMHRNTARHAGPATSAADLGTCPALPFSANPVHSSRPE